MWESPFREPAVMHGDRVEKDQTVASFLMTATALCDEQEVEIHQILTHTYIEIR